MGKFRKKPVVIEAITFEELVEYGKANSSNPLNIVNGMPWSFKYKGHPISHENDRCYLIPTLEGTHNMTPDDMLITGVQGEIYPCKIDIFKATYEEVEPDCAHYWIPQGTADKPDFRMMHGIERVHATCSKCNARSFFTREQWRAIPAALPPTGE